MPGELLSICTHKVKNGFETDGFGAFFAGQAEEADADKEIPVMERT